MAYWTQILIGTLFYLPTKTVLKFSQKGAPNKRMPIVIKRWKQTNYHTLENKLEKFIKRYD